MTHRNDETLKYRANIEGRLKKLWIKEVLLSVWDITLKFLGFLGGGLLLLESAEAVFRFSSKVRTVIFFVFLISLLLFLIFQIVENVFLKHRLFQSIDYYRLAEVVGRKYPQIKDELKNALQILDEASDSFSPSLVEAAFQRVYQKAEGLDFSKAKEFSFSFRQAFSLLLSLAVILLNVFAPSFGGAYYRLLNYGKEFKAPPKYSFVVEPGNTTITKGDNLLVKVKLKGGKKEEITLKKKSLEDYDFVSSKLKADSTGIFKKQFFAVSSSFQYFVEAEGFASDTFQVKVINRPIIIELSITAVPPAYSKLPKTVQKDDGNLSCLPGTKVKFSILSSKELFSALLILNNHKTVPMEVNNDRAYTSLTVLEEFSYHFEIFDKDSVKNENPIEYYIKLEKDALPLIEVVRPPKDVKLGSENILPFLINISDDYGFSSLKLFYRLSASAVKRTSEKFDSVSIPIDLSKIEEEVFYNWNLFPLALSENDVVTYYLEIKDNDNVNGPKAARTGLRTIRVPSLDELFNEAEKTQEVSQDELRKTYRQAEKLREEIEKISNELKKNKKKISWEEKQKIERAAKSFKELQKKAEEISKQLEKVRKELQKNNLLSKETLKKYLELQKLFDQMNSESLKKAFEKMNQMLQSMLRNKAQMSVEQLKLNEEALRKSLERTINLLKRIQIEQKMDELLKRTEKLIKKQKEVADSIGQKKNLSEDLKKKLEKQQKEIKRGIKKLQEEMKKLAEKMKEVKDMPAKEMEKTEKDFKEQKNSELSEKAESQLQKGQYQQALQTQMQITKNLSATKKSLSQIQNSVRMKNQLEVMTKMLSLINNLLDLSKAEESLKNKTASLSPQSPSLSDIARQQNDLREALDKIIKQMTELSQKTFAITPEMGKAIGSAISQMNSAIYSLQNRNSSAAVIDQRGAMKYLNEAAQLMQGALSNMMKPGGTGGGMMSLMQQLQQLAGQQLSLNQMAKMLKNGGLGQKQLAQMQRLAQQQRLIQKTLEELNKELKQSGESKKLTTNLDRLVKEMGEVVSDLATQKLDDNLIKKQERILSRLLDAQRSINERDYEKRRESQAGKQFKAQSPPALLLQSEEGRSKLRDALLKALREGYSKDYEELIRKYFEQLERRGIKDSL